jgi:iron complex outermembrane receptor protein
MKKYLIAVLAVPLVAAAQDVRLAQIEELSRMSLEDLASVEVTSVSKTAQSLSSAPAAIYVITHEEIRRAGALSIPEALRLAPNMQVTQLSSSGYSITARGFGDKREVQTQANKLLILIDGRSVYSPLFSGVFYDALDVAMDDLDRIEVISGPGATLWGANAMNGVINIITRSSAGTQGALLHAGAGIQEQTLTTRYGGRFGEATTYRVYGKAFERASVELASGASANDRWNKTQGGFRVDHRRGAHKLTFQGDVFRADQGLLTEPNISMNGANALGRWERTTERSDLMVQAYYDRLEREAPSDGAPFTVNTYDVEFQHSFRIGSAHRIVWGGGRRINNYSVTNIGSLQFIPPHRALELGNVFVQDTIALGRGFELTAGLKLEDNPYSEWTALPDLRLSWSHDETLMLWGAISHAIRAPTPFDADVAEFLGPTLFIAGNPEFRNEEVTAYEIGYRGQPHPRISLSVSAFYGTYDDLRTVEPGPTVIPLLWDNRLEGDTYGVEAWANLQVTSWWRLSPGYRSLEKDLEFKPGASGLLNADQAGNDPPHGWVLKSSMDFSRGITFDVLLRHIGALPEPAHRSYDELDARIGWVASPSIEVSLTGTNLLHDTHTEYASPGGLEIPRSVLAEVRWSF